MSVDLSPGSVERDSTEYLAEFLDAYYREEIQRMAAGASNDKTLHVDTTDLELFFGPEEYQKILSDPKRHNEMLSKAVAFTDAGQGHIESANATIVDTVGADIPHIGVAEINSEHVGDYIGVQGQLSAVTKVRSFPQKAVWSCQGCGVKRTTRPDTRELNEPTDGCNCERAPRWELYFKESEFVDHRMLKIQQPPEDAANGETQHIVTHVFGEDTKDADGTPLTYRAGEDVVVYGVVELRQEEGRGAAEYLFNHYLTGHTVTFEDGGLEAVNVNDHKEEVQLHAEAPDVYERFYTSLAPQIHPTPQMELAMKVCAAYLFAAPRIDPEGDGPMYRGDIHAAIFGDPGMAKSVLLAGVSEFSPEAEHRSATGLSSDVGLVAAAVDDEFGDGGWTLKPGILVRAGMHAIIDEIDKGPDDLEKINDALEGRQIATVDKGGIKADLKTRTGFLTSGNPKDGRFSKHEPLAAQIDVEESLLTRFDAIVLLQDEPDEEQDRAIAEHITDSFMEGVELVREDGDGDVEATERIVSPEVGRAWVALGRRIVPRITDEAAQRLEDYYVEARSINKTQDENERFSATARQLEGGIRFSMAFARMRLSETVEAQDVDMAIDVAKALIGQTYDSESGSFDIDYLEGTGSRDSTPQKDRKQRILGVLDEPRTPAEVAAMASVSEEVAEDELETMARQGDVIKPETGVYRGVE